MSYLAVDCETTGLTEECQVLTAYFIILDVDLNVISSLDLKIKHSMYNVQAKALEINGIDIVAHDKLSQSLGYCTSALKQFLKTSERLIPIGHNVAFDIKMLKSNGILSSDICNTHLSYTSIDTCVIAQFLKACGVLPNNTSLSLANLCKYFEITKPESLNLHNAECDIKMTVDLLKKMKSIVNLHKVTKRKRNHET